MDKEKTIIFLTSFCVSRWYSVGAGPMHCLTCLSWTEVVSLELPDLGV